MDGYYHQLQVTIQTIRRHTTSQSRQTLDYTLFSIFYIHLLPRPPRLPRLLRQPALLHCPTFFLEKFLLLCLPSRPGIPPAVLGHKYQVVARVRRVFHKVAADLATIFPHCPKDEKHLENGVKKYVKLPKGKRSWPVPIYITRQLNYYCLHKLH
jgi:hypothetical protein